MGIEATGKGNNNPAPRKTGVPVTPQADPLPTMAGDAIHWSLPPQKLQLPPEAQQDQRQAFAPAAFDKGPAFKLPRLGVSKDLGDGMKLDLDATFKHGGGVKVGFKKTF
jgi:hypothetical protein